jgi:hypothetical protein
MFELIWGIFNAVVLIYFFVICIKSVKIVRDGLGGLAGLVLVIGLLSFISKEDSKNLAEKNIDFYNKESSNNSSKRKFSGNSFYQYVSLEKKLTSEIWLDIYFGEEKNDLVIISANCMKSGLVSGTKWNVHSIQVDKPKNKNYCNYFVSGSVDWRIMGLNLYSESKIFEGKVILKK